ncbi:polysaccharide deacetylase family protein [Paenibacillus sp. Soil787]|uniref:polysaccharide deacetylase family protein n=1 Tax=Paenibacillus sp. Soil787 TaxID=1736411 RepID=UPI0006F8CA3F|nr:polysaccharide deacetylase family protein [Paenibacillus sp. Soil787]KRF43963.1 hypothetical protein ASG93_03355 [Paenibacillus sp. Soil787]
MRKITLLILIVTFLISDVATVKGNESDNLHKVLIIYSLKDEADMKQVKILDILVGHFTKDSTIISDQEIDSVDKNNYTHILYIGLQKKTLEPRLIDYIELFNGPVFLINNNIEQFTKRFSFVHTKGATIVNSVKSIKNGLEQSLPEGRLATILETSDVLTRVLVEGKTKTGSVPILINKDQSYYLAIESLFNPIGNIVGETLFAFFNEGNSKGKTLYLRLEDVHPKTEVRKLKQIAEYLKNMNIPYMVAVIPVYTNPKTHKEMHLKDAPELVSVLRYMQDNGGSIIMHGYRHQYRDSETGEGFEYWDVEQDRPIMQDRNEKTLTKNDFNSEQAYKEYVEKSEKFESDYIENTLNKGVQELVTHKLYPLAFEAPHYAMSQNGYKITAQHFTTYVGQLQISNLTWKSDYAPLFETKPNYLHGMNLLPETIGFIAQNDENALNNMVSLASKYNNYSDVYISAFYHPYLGLEKLKNVIEKLQTIPDANWLDLKKRNNKVEVSGVTIVSDSGDIKVDKAPFASDYERNYTIKKRVIWYGIPLTILVLVLLIIWRNKKQRNK